MGATARRTEAVPEARVSQTTWEELLAVCRRMDRYHRVEQEALLGAPYDPEQAAARLWEPLRRGIGFGLTVLEAGEPVAAMGLVFGRPGAASTWLAATEGAIRRHVDRMAALARQGIEAALGEGGVQRVEALVGWDDPPTRTWMGLIGLEREAVLRRYAGGRDWVMYSRVV